MIRRLTSRTAIAVSVAVLLPASMALAQEGTPPPNVPAPGEPRTQEQLPEAPAEEVLKDSPPIEKAAPPADAGRPDPAPLPNTLPPAKKIEPRVPNT